MRVAVKSAGLHPREEQFITWVRANLGARAPKIVGAFAALSTDSGIASPAELLANLPAVQQKLGKRVSPATADSYARRFTNAYRAWNEAESQIVERLPNVNPPAVSKDDQLQLEVASLLEEAIRWPTLQPFLLPFCANLLRQGKR